MPKKTDKPARKSAQHEETPASLVDQQLARYRAMRDFATTAEPSGAAGGKTKKKAEEGLPFVVQKHAATRLHYDFRLGWKGVLKSWAVTKGPSFVVADKRLAVEVEDHPMEYGGFEGTIPKGQYGGGTVMVWDTGTWEPITDVDEGLKKGQLKFILHGKKLKGHWALIRIKNNRFGDKGKNNWLLIKEHDEYERTPDDPAITDEEPDSAVTGRSLEQIAAAEDHVWNSHVPEKKGPANRSLLTRRSAASKAAEQPVPGLVKNPGAKSHSAARSVKDRETLLRDAPREKMPGFLPPELASSVDQPPDGDDWLHELKLDGYRIQIHLDEKDGKRRARLFTRKGLDWTHRMRELAETAAELPVHTAIVDGEVVVLNEKGLTSFADLQAAFDEGAPNPLTYFAFDLLHLDGHNLRNLPLERRKAILEGLVQEHGEDGIRYSSHIRANGGEMFHRICQMGAEGVISKLATSTWRGDRSRQWLKSKCVLQQEFVVGGFAPLSTGSHGIGSLLLGYYEDGELIYAGRTGTGFNQKTHKLLRDRLEELRQAKPAFQSLPNEAKKDAIWVKPSLVVEARFANWTGDNLVRQAAFMGVREDKDPKEVVRETTGHVPKSARARAAEEKPAAKAESHSTTKTAKHAPPATTAAKIEKHPPHKSRDRAVVAGISISHPDKILDEASHLTKMQLVEYYDAVADHLLPHIADRPLSIVRCPEGSGKPCFFQKQIGKGMPAGIDSVPVTVKKGGNPQREEYVTVSKREGLVGLGQMGVMELHPWGSSNDTLEQPDRIIIDLDPDPELPWKRLVACAIEVRDLMKHLGLETFVKSTGGKGIHVVAPITPKREWPEIKEFAHHFVLMMERANSKLYLTKMTKSARTGRIFLDYLRNERGATAVAPYSPRARAGARVAMPLTWKELEHTDPKQFAVANFDEWKARLKRDPWLEMNKVRQQINDRAIAAVAEMAGQKS